MFAASSTCFFVIENYLPVRCTAELYQLRMAQIVTRKTFQWERKHFNCCICYFNCVFYWVYLHVLSWFLLGYHFCCLVDISHPACFFHVHLQTWFGIKKQNWQNYKIDELRNHSLLFYIGTNKTQYNFVQNVHLQCMVWA